ncbi:zinc-binding alcohol dehydrogenase [Blautia schinkii]|nr:zinc-binding alcohol dehydrogenase [Blautia schinkii]
MAKLEVISTEPRKAFIREYEDAPLKDHEIRAEVHYAAAKHGTEFTHFRGLDPFLEHVFDEELLLFQKSQEAAEKPFCMRPGNMWVGQVTEIGAGVTGISIGERIAGYGPFKSTHTLKEHEALRMPDRMTWKEAMCYDPLQFALGGIRDGQVRVGDNVVISGLGAIGLLAAQLARLAGAARVIVCDPIEKRRQTALDNGADMALDSSAVDVGLEIKKATDGRGADVAVETSGNYHALQQVIRGIAYNGNIAVVGWYHECSGGLDLGREAHFNQPNILISRACSEPNREYPRWSFERICKTSWDMLGKGMLKCENLVDPVVPIEKAADTYMEIEQNPSGSVKLGVVFGKQG